MNYETVMNNIELNKTITISHIIDVIEQLLKSYEDEQEQSWEQIYQLIRAMKAVDIYNGNSDHYHNLAVTLAREDQYGLACDVLEIGLRFFGESMDLLADFIAYATQCNRMTEGQMYLDKLMTIERALWNWRAFDFSIDFLSERAKIQDEEQQIKDNACIDELLLQYQKYFPKDEKAYFAEYTVMTSRNKEEEAILKLEEIVSKNNFKAPRCALKIAEYYFDGGEYDLAEKYINQCKIYVTASELSVEIGNVYMLSALCGMCKIYKEGIEKLRNNGELKTLVEKVYIECKAAGAIYNRRRFQGYRELEMQHDILEVLSEIKDYED